MKHEWRKKEKELYIPKNKPVIVDIPNMTYLTIKDQGNPNSPIFSECIEALYALSYGIRMLPKKGITPEGYFEYTVYPLEGIWDLSEKGRKAYQKGVSILDLKDEMLFKIMIRQPEFVTQDLFDSVKDMVMEKKKNPRIKDVSLEVIKEGKSIQMLHIGPYDDEPDSFKIMEEYCNDNGFVRLDKTHKEIYLSDPKKVAPDKLKTTLRFWIEEA